MDRISKALELARERRAENRRSAVVPVKGQDHIPCEVAKSIDVSTEFFVQQKIIAGFADDPIADSYRMLRTRVLQLMSENGWNTLGITSTTPQAGKTLTAINLGMAIAMNPTHSVLLVDADLRNPSVAKMLGIEPEGGLVQYLTSDMPSTNDLLISPGVDRFSILPCKQRITGSSELLSDHKMTELVATLKSQSESRVVIFDLPPILVGDNVVSLSSHLDAILFIVEDGKTSSKDLNRAVDLLKGVNLLGTVLNKSRDNPADSYGYY